MKTEEDRLGQNSEVQSYIDRIDTSSSSEYGIAIYIALHLLFRKYRMQKA